MLCTHTCTLNYSALCQQPGSISSNGDSKSYTHTHTPEHKHTSFIAKETLVSSTLLLRPNTNVHTHCIFLSTWLQLGVEQDKELQWASLNTDRWETSYTSRCLPTFSPTQTNTDALDTRTRHMTRQQQQWVNQPLPAGFPEKRVSLYSSSVIWVTSKKQHRDSPTTYISSMIEYDDLSSGVKARPITQNGSFISSCHVSLF